MDVPQSKKILVIEIVEDETSMLAILNDKFASHGIHVIQAKDGAEGLRLALSERPDLIILDLLMPKMDGVEMLKQLREDPWGKDARVVILTNWNHENKIDNSLKNDSYEFLIKSEWQIDDLIKKIQEKLEA